MVNAADSFSTPARGNETADTPGARIRKIRESRALTQDQMAGVLNVTANYIGEVERGRKPLSRKVAARVCEIYGVTYDYLYHGITSVNWKGLSESGGGESLASWNILQQELQACSPEEIIVAQHLVSSYLSASRGLNTEEPKSPSRPAPHAGKPDADGRVIRDLSFEGRKG